MTRSSRLVSQRSKPSRYLYLVCELCNGKSEYPYRSSCTCPICCHIYCCGLKSEVLFRSSSPTQSRASKLEQYPDIPSTVPNEGMMAFARRPAKWILVSALLTLYVSLCVEWVWAMALGGVRYAIFPRSHICLQLKRVASIYPEFYSGTYLVCAYSDNIQCNTQSRNPFGWSNEIGLKDPSSSLDDSQLNYRFIQSQILKKISTFIHAHQKVTEGEKPNVKILPQKSSLFY